MQQKTIPLIGLPHSDRYGPHQLAHDLAWDYMKDANLTYRPIRFYTPVDKNRARRIADQYALMADAPYDPIVKRAYDVLAAETLAQYQFVKRSGLVVEFNDRTCDPYQRSPRMATQDIVQNNHLWVLSSDEFGTDTVNAAGNLLMTYCDEFAGGRRLRINDVFRIVHDFFGHTKDGIGFRADGEENAWRSHATMYSRLALAAMTSEFRGQNSWLNYGPYGAANRTASAAKTIYAEQKNGLLPAWCWDEGREDPA